ncbi:MAG: surface layer protein B, partial [Armatimonadetes bacterium]|nr:surface layer protein B [Armatimonadota bacterium]
MKAGRTPPSRFLVAVAAVLVLTFGPAPRVGAQAGATPSVAPANPRFVQYMEDLKSEQMLAEEDGHSLGFVPPPVDLPNVTAKSALAGRALVGLPSTYDLRTQDKLTSVKDQGSCGSCWAFAAYGSLESCLKPGEVWDFSENHLKNTSGFDLGCCEGGNEYMATAYLARWNGPIAEADDPYNAGSCTSSSGLTPVKHVQNVDFIPDRIGPLDNDAIKQAVMTYGAVYTTMYWNAACYSSATSSY